MEKTKTKCKDEEDHRFFAERPFSYGDLVLIHLHIIILVVKRAAFGYELKSLQIYIICKIACLIGRKAATEKKEVYNIFNI